MLIYFVTFFFSCFIIHIIEKKSEKSVSFIVGSFVALFLPCLLAAMRADTIGDDVRGYINPLCNLALNAGSIADYFQGRWWDSYQFRYVTSIEPLFNVLVLLTIRFFHSKQLLLGVIQLLTICPLYYGMKKLLPKGYLWMGMFVYYMMFYNVSLNMMRQWIAMSLLIYALTFLMVDDNLKYCLYVVIAFLFHKSALMGLGFFFLEKLLKKEKRLKKIKVGNIFISANVIQIALVFTIALIMFLLPNLIVFFLNNIGLSRYSHYINVSPDFLITQLIIRLPLLILFLLHIKKNISEIKYQFLFCLLILDCIFSNYVSGAAYMFRISCWFSSYNVVAYPMLLSKFAKRKRIVSYAFIIAYLVFYWWYYFYYCGSHGTVPYKSIWSV